MNDQTKCGYVVIVGRPNVGKSTLLNALIGKKISIISDKPQTTRHQITGIKTIDSVQLVYIDTPGMHKEEKRAMNRYMNRLAGSVIADANAVVFMIEALRWVEEDELVLSKLSSDVPVILAMNKIDKVKDKTKLLPFIEKLTAKFNFAHIVPLSAKSSGNVSALEKAIIDLMPLGPHLFPEDQTTDKNERFLIAEIIREKLIRTTSQELPYSTTVVIESMKTTSRKIDIEAIIWVERDGQKPIVIGKDGEKLKKIGMEARKEIERLLGNHVFLRLWVKVKNDWTNDERALGSMGYE